MQTWLVELSDDECDDLLATARLGRLAVIVDGRPEIFPVVHVYDRATRTVLFPTNEATKLHAALSWPYVAFEVDGESGDEGWSVLVVGRAEAIGSVDQGELFHRRSVNWRLGREARWVQIVPEKITGRRISAVVR